MIAPLMTCSARLPVYTLLIGAFIPRRMIGPFNLQGVTLFVLYLAGVAGAMIVAFAIKRLFMRGDYHPLMLELPEYKWPTLRNLALGLWERARIFLARVGTVLLTLMVVLWFLASFPAAPAGATAPAISYSFAGRLGHALLLLHRMRLQSVQPVEHPLLLVRRQPIESRLPPQLLFLLLRCQVPMIVQPISQMPRPRALIHPRPHRRGIPAKGI